MSAPANIETIVRKLRSWTADWVPKPDRQHGFKMKSATMIAREFPIDGAFIWRWTHYSRRHRCGLCGKLIDHGQACIELWPRSRRETLWYHHDEKECAT